MGANESLVGPSEPRERSWSQWTLLPQDSGSLLAWNGFDHLLESSIKGTGLAVLFSMLVHHVSFCGLGALLILMQMPWMST